MRRKENNISHKLFTRRLKRFFWSTVLIVLIVIAVFLTISRREDKSELIAKDIKIEDLKRQISNEEEKAEDLKKKQEYVPYEDYIEDIARSELGLIKEDEIILRPQE